MAAQTAEGSSESHPSAEQPEDPDPSPSSTMPEQSALELGPLSDRESFFARLKSAVGLGPASSLRENIADALDADESDASSDQFSPEERTILRNLLGLRERRVDDAMVPRAEIVAVDASISLADLLKISKSAGHSRFPVYRDTLDEPLGMVHIKDVLGEITRAATMTKAQSAARTTQLSGGLDLKKVKLDRSLSATKLTRKVLFVPPSMPALDLLAQMQATRIHMAIVVDEYGGTDGLVTIEDLVEEIVGDIEDEHDDDDEMIRVGDDGMWLVDARVLIEDLSKETGVDFSADEASEEIDTLGGLLVTRLGRVPVRGELIPYGSDMEFEVIDADPRRLKRLKVARRSVRTAALNRTGESATPSSNQS